MPPLRGLSKRHSAFPQIGVIRKGAPKGERTIGRDLDYFRIEFDENEKELEQEVLAHYPAEPKELVILLPFNDIRKCFERYNEAYVAGAMVHRCDCEDGLILREIDLESGKVRVSNGLSVETGEPVYCKGEPVGYYTTTHGKREAVHCKPVGRLKVLLQPIRRLAYMTVLTTSAHDVVNLEAQLNAIWEFNVDESGAHRIVGIPLVLRRRKSEISTPTPEGKRVRRVKSLLSIEADPAWVEYRLAQTSREVLPSMKFALLPERAEVVEGEPEADEPEPEEQMVAAELAEESGAAGPSPTPAKSFKIQDKKRWEVLVEWAVSFGFFPKTEQAPYLIQEALKAGGIAEFNADTYDDCTELLIARNNKTKGD